MVTEFLAPTLGRGETKGRVSSASVPDGQRSTGLSLDGIYRDHAEFVWRNARRLGCEDDWVEDAVHEVFLVVGQRLAEFEPRAQVRTWLFAITYRVVRRLRRNRFRYLTRLLRWKRDALASASTSPHARSEAEWELGGILARLDDAKRAVLILSELEGMTTAEISECLGLRPGTVSSRLRAARQEARLWAERQASDKRRTHGTR